MPWITVADSDIGSREEQQDRYLVVRNDKGSSQLLVVADGAGGHTMGAMAAQAAITHVRENIAGLWLSEDPLAFLKSLIVECNQRVLALTDTDLACSTIVMVFMRSDELFWGHVGDSRFYLIRNGEVISQTRDHSIGELQQRQSEQATQTFKASDNELYMCLGGLADITPELDSSAAREGDSLLLCSDGLWGQTDMLRTFSELSNTGISQEGLAKLVAKSISAAKIAKPENSDNITLIASKYLERPTFVRRLLNAIFKKNA